MRPTTARELAIYCEVLVPVGRVAKIAGLARTNIVRIACNPNCLTPRLQGSISRIGCAEIERATDVLLLRDPAPLLGVWGERE